MDRDQLIEELKKIPSNYEVEPAYSNERLGRNYPVLSHGPIRAVRRADVGTKILIIFDSTETT